jgi:hypothetical protein
MPVAVLRAGLSPRFADPIGHRRGALDECASRRVGDNLTSNCELA